MLYSSSIHSSPMLLAAMAFRIRFTILLAVSLLPTSLSHDGDALLRIKNSFREVDSILRQWTPSSWCDWTGVACDNATFTVVSLNLSGLNLEGEISTAVGDLRSLQTLDLSRNRLSGQIPDEIGDCSLLRTLDLSFNQINGDIPFSISKLKKLEILVLKNNRLIGPLPSTLSQIPNLKVLDLAMNQLSGEIPRLLYWNEVLQYLGLRGNNLVGTLSPDICQLSGLWFFDVRNNSLTGSIPQSIGNCTSFQVLDLSYNQLTGEIPFNIGFLQVATLSLQGNQFSGFIPPVIGLMQALAVLDLSCNKFVGPILPILGNLTYTEKLYLNGNQLNGSIPPELGNMTKLHYLELNDNLLSGHIPPELGQLTDLFDLNIANNNLEGPIPDNLSSCTSLNSLNAHGNKLNGTIPPALKRLASMTYMNLSSNNLSGSIPIELSLIGNLDTLDVSYNKLTGMIPSSLGGLEHLLKMNLSRNRLSGDIPTEFGNLKSVMEIDFSNNLLSGTLPEELGQLQNMLLLKLEYNNLSGDVMSLVDCPSLVILNLSYNNIIGNIPSINNFSRFSPDSFIGNPGLCGYWTHSCSQYPTNRRVTVPNVAILAIALGAVLFLLTIIIAVYRTEYSKPFIDGSIDKPVRYSKPKLVILNMNMALHVHEDIMRMTENLSEKYIIGHGASSTVYKCTLKNCKPIAIKRIYSYTSCLKEFETELETIGSIKHRNLVCLQGYSLSPSGNLLFYDYMENGSLWDQLHGPMKRKKMDWETRLRIAIGAAEGLAYLHHDCCPRIIHRDVKSSNILLDRNFEAHLTDFGIAKTLCISKPYTSTYILGTIGYIDPDYARTSRLTEKSDVYSFGVVMLELLTGRKAVDDESNLHHLMLAKTANNAVMEAVDPEIASTCKDMEAVKILLQLAFLCTKKQPMERPSMQDVSRILRCIEPSMPPMDMTSVPPSSAVKMSCYKDEYVNLKTSNAVDCSMSTADAHFFLKFGD